MTYQDLVDVTAEAKKMDIKGKNYIPCVERVKAFRKIFPHGAIETEMLEIDDDHCVIRASVYDNTESGSVLLGTGTAREEKNSSNVNRAAFVQNCETSAVARAIGFAGIGIDADIASYEEVVRAKLYEDSQKKIGKDRGATLAKRIAYIIKKAAAQGTQLSTDDLMNKFGVTKYEDLTEENYSEINQILTKHEKRYQIDGIEFREVGQ